MNRERTAGLIQAILAPIIWGGALSSGRVVSRYLPPITTGFIRFSIAMLILYPMYRSRVGKLPKLSKREKFLIAFISLFGMVLFNIFMFTSLKTITAIRSSILLAFTPVVVLLFCMVLYRKRIRWIEGFGIALSVTGALLTVTAGNFSSVLENGLAFGDITMLLAVLSWAVYSLLIEEATRTISSFSILIMAGTLGLIILFPLTFIEGGWQRIADLPVHVMFNLLYLGVGAAGFAYIWYFEGVRVLGSSTASTFLNLEPVAAITIGVLFLSEVLTLPLAAGALLVISGLFLTSRTG